MKKIFALVLSFAIVFSNVAALGFSDTDSVAWAENAIDFLVSKGIVNGYEDGSFRPQNNVTRAEFAKIICLSFDRSIMTDGFDANVDTSHWAYDYISDTFDVVYTYGKEYKPDDYATRAEIAYALANVLELEITGEDMNLRFSDWDSVEEDMKNKVASAVSAGLMEGYENGEIRGDGFVTRAEIAMLIVRAMNYTPQNTLPDSGDNGESEEVVPDDTIVEPDTDDDKNNESKPEDDIFEGLDHLYTVNPIEEIYIITSASRMLSEKTGDEACRITYRIAGEGDEQYSSVVEADTRIYGAKNDVFTLDAGDAFIVDMMLLTRISGIYVLTSFDGGYEDCLDKMYVPNGRRIAAYGANTDYEVLCGTLTEKKINTKSVSLTVKFDGGEETVHVLKGVDVDLFTSGRRLKWESVSALSLDEETPTLVYIRLTNGRVTEVLACEY